jgi:hypothetical protein
VLIIEGPRAGRLHLANAIGAELGYGIHHIAATAGYAQLAANANHANSILFFDEAEALFEKRSYFLSWKSRGAKSARLMRQTGQV